LMMSPISHCRSAAPPMPKRLTAVTARPMTAAGKTRRVCAIMRML